VKAEHACFPRVFSNGGGPATAPRPHHPAEVLRSGPAAAIAEHHASREEAGRVFLGARPTLAAYTHIVRRRAHLSRRCHSSKSRWKLAVPTKNARDAQLGPLPRRVGLAARDQQPQAVRGEAGVLALHPDQLVPPQRPGKAWQQQRPVTLAASPSRQVGPAGGSRRCRGRRRGHHAGKSAQSAA
jgi:hypothetical protein